MSINNTAPVTLLVATKNRNKVREIETILADFASKEENRKLPQIRLVTLDDIGFDGEIEENGTSFEENARIKARAAAALGYIAIADDSGICVSALGGAPGIYSARYSGGNDDDNNRKLLIELEKTGSPDRSACYSCALSCEYPDGREGFVVFAECAGELLEEYRGSGGFGYDPLFYSHDLKKTFAEATEEEKDAVSHRGRAVREFAGRFFENLRETAEAKKPECKASTVLTAAERAYLRSLAVHLDTVFQIGKGGISEETVRQISNALEARELIKARVLDNSGYTAKRALSELAAATGAAEVQAVGSRFILYRPSKKHRKIDLKNASK